jgi:hypothetical protein
MWVTQSLELFWRRSWWAFMKFHECRSKCRTKHNNNCFVRFPYNANSKYVANMKFYKSDGESSFAVAVVKMPKFCKCSFHWFILIDSCIFCIISFTSYITFIILKHQPKLKELAVGCITAEFNACRCNMTLNWQGKYTLFTSLVCELEENSKTRSFAYLAFFASDSSDDREPRLNV